MLVVLRHNGRMDEIETTYSQQVSDRAKARMRRERLARKWTFDKLAELSGIKRPRCPGGRRSTSRTLWRPPRRPAGSSCPLPSR